MVPGGRLRRHAAAIFRTSGEAYCATCTGAPVGVGSGCGAIPSAGVTASWDGFAITGGAATCGGGTACLASEFMPAGDYVVTMCSGCVEQSPDAGVQCVSVPFQYPSSAEIVGTLPAR